MTGYEIPQPVHCRYNVMSQMAPQFTWDSTISKFVGPAQKANMEKAAVQSAKLEEDKQV